MCMQKPEHLRYQLIVVYLTFAIYVCIAIDAGIRQ